MQQSGSGGSGAQGNMQKIGEGLGGLVGQAADNALGMVGAMMNNMGGWWAQAANPQQGQGTGSVHASFNTEADNRCRSHFEAHGSARGAGQASTSGSTRSYEDTRPLYQFGHMASQNPAYRGRAFHEVEGELKTHWGNEQTQRHGSWPDVRGFVEFGYSGQPSGSGGSSAGASGGTTGGASGSVRASGSTGP